MSREADRRLHPVSLFFHLGAGLKDFLIPIVVSLFASRSDRWPVLVPAIIAGLASVGAMLKYFSYTYRYGEDDLVVRTGMIFRNERHIPYDRIQNIDAVQNVVHRFFNVAVIQVQTGSGKEPEATLSVLPMSAVAEMRQRVLEERESLPAPALGTSEAAVDAPSERPAPRTLLHLSPRELMLAGVVENRGAALIFAAMGALSQFDPLEKFLEKSLPEAAPAWLEKAIAANLVSKGLAIAGGVVLLILVATLFMRILSTVWALVRLYDFTLVRDGNDLRLTYGSFTRVSATIPLRRVQTVSIHQRVLHRWMDRAAIRVTTAGASGVPGVDGADEASGDREWLAPIIPTKDIPRLLEEIDSSLDLHAIDWTPAHPRAAWRMMRISGLWALAISGVLVPFIGWWGAVTVAALLTIRAIARARGIARNLGCAVIGARVAFRGGWLHQVVNVARFERIQSALFYESFFDRRNQMAGVAIDTAGMGQGLSMHFLPTVVARQLHEKLSQAAVRTPFTW